MSATLVAKGLEAAHGDGLLFAGLDLVVGPGNVVGVNGPPRAGAVVATMRGAVVRRGAFTLGPVSLQIDWADRVAITGANGSGKTTLPRPASIR